MGLIDSILCEIEVAPRPRRKVKTEADARKRTQDAATMEIPAMEWIVQIAIRCVITQREAASHFRGLGFRRRRQADGGRECRHGQNAHAKIAAIKHRGYVL